jgi:SpoVK/Ycf46/Vps4 family AAA+-type ATPase
MPRYGEPFNYHQLLQQSVQDSIQEMLKAMNQPLLPQGKPMATTKQEAITSPFYPNTTWGNWFNGLTAAQKRLFINGSTIDGHAITRPRRESPEQCIPIDEYEEMVNPKPKAEVHFESVILDAEKKQQILEALEQVHQSELIFDTWGFGETIEKGRGVSLLFYGPPGTGKTLMAQAIATELKVKLNVISTADVESSAPGEAERNIRKHFAEAKKKGNVLLFDECDSLIYSRNGVGPIMAAQVNELLSQLERFEGVTVFTTNRLGTLDEAFNRRLALKLEFPMPTPEMRVKIWQRMIPAKAPVAKNIDWKKLANVELSGGYIKNAVLRAARMAAIEKLPNDKKKITMQHFVTALKHEALSMVDFEQAQEKHQREFRSVRVTSGDIHRGV